MIHQDKFQQIIKDHIGTDAVFVEIGAYDGSTFSNTAVLADQGWKGYYFEPVLEYALQCMNRHQNNDVTVIPVALGTPGIRKLAVSNALSTLQDSEYQDKIKSMEWFKKANFVDRNVMVFDPNCIPECNLLVIDVEGSEIEIIEKLSVQPKVIMIELHEDSNEWGFNKERSNQCVSILEAKGYTKIYKDDVDSIFIYGI